MTEMHYLVWRKNGGRKPRFKHANIEDARTEAKRLAEMTGAKMLILAVIAEVEPPAPTPETKENP